MRNISKGDSKLVFYLRRVYFHVQDASMHFAVLSAFSRSDVMQKCGEKREELSFTFRRIFVNGCEQNMAFKYPVYCVWEGV